MGRASPSLLPPSEGQTESQRTDGGLWEAPTLRKKQQFGQCLGSQGSRPPPWQRAAARLNTTPQLYRVWPGLDLSIPPPSSAGQQGWGSHPGTIEAPWQVTKRSSGPHEVKQRAQLLLKDIDLVPLHSIKVIVQCQQHQKGPKHGDGGQEVPDVMVIKEVEENAVPIVLP